jgi:hypothetical protein
MASWETDLVLMLRVLIGDLITPPKNMDAYLKRVLIAAGILVVNDIDLVQDYIFDISNITIVPDPIDTKDILAQALIPLKAACIMNQAQFQVSLSQGIRVRDGDSSLDTSVSFGGFKDILQLGPCAAYAKLVNQLSAASSSLVGGAVLGAYRGPNDGAIETVSWFYDQISERVNIRY